MPSSSVARWLRRDGVLRCREGLHLRWDEGRGAKWWLLAALTDEALIGNDLARFCVHFVQSRSQALSKFDRVPHRPEVHEKESGLFVQHVAVDGRDLNAVRTCGRCGRAGGR